MKQRIGLQQIDYSEIGMGQVVWARDPITREFVKLGSVAAFDGMAGCIYLDQLTVAWVNPELELFMEVPID